MIAPLTADDLLAIAQRADAATPGPWLAVNYETHPEEAGENWDITDDPAWMITTDCVPVSAVSDPADDYAFIAHARADIPRLIATIAALQAAGAGLVGWILREHGPDRSAFEECAATGCQECRAALAALTAWADVAGVAVDGAVIVQDVPPPPFSTQD